MVSIWFYLVLVLLAENAGKPYLTLILFSAFTSCTSCSFEHPPSCIYNCLKRFHQGCARGKGGVSPSFDFVTERLFQCWLFIEIIFSYSQDFGHFICLFVPADCNEITSYPFHAPNTAIFQPIGMTF